MLFRSTEDSFTTRDRKLIFIEICRLTDAGEFATYERLFPWAEKNKIDIQRAAVYRATGTDTDAFAYSNAGVASALISLPLRYMHTTVEMVAKDDVEAVIQLIYHSLKGIKNNQDWRYIK